jgi:hypothetical protein
MELNSKYLDFLLRWRYNGEVNHVSTSTVPRSIADNTWLRDKPKPKVLPENIKLINKPHSVMIATWVY